MVNKSEFPDYILISEGQQACQEKEILAEGLSIFKLLTKHFIPIEICSLYAKM